MENAILSKACWKDLAVHQTGALTGLRYAPPLRPDYSQRPPEAQLQPTKSSTVPRLRL
jgi:hypothetical protein